MPFVAMRELCPEIAGPETRTITVMPGNAFALPPDQYQFWEMYCNEKGCDCRRVFFSVVSSAQQEVQAVIAWGWETAAFYKRWLDIDNPHMIREMQGPCLNRVLVQPDREGRLVGLASEG